MIWFVYDEPWLWMVSGDTYHGNKSGHDMVRETRTMTTGTLTMALEEKLGLIGITDPVHFPHFVEDGLA